MQSIPMTRRRAAIILGATLALGGITFVRPAPAHEAPCPFCAQTLTQDTATQDNEVTLKLGKKRIEYKCVYCALSEAKTEYKGDLSILAPSEKKGEPVTLKRTDGKWTASEENVAFVAQKANHKICNVTYRAFTTIEAAQVYIANNKEQLPDTKPLTLAQMLEIVDKTNEKAK